MRRETFAHFFVLRVFRDDVRCPFNPVFTNELLLLQVLLIVLSALADVWKSCVGQYRRFDSDLFRHCRIGKFIYFYGV